MDDKLSIKELVNYYVDRYHLPKSKSSDSSSDFQEMHGLYISQITRILKNTQVCERNLWDMIKPEQGARKISISDFQKYCFDKWSDYIKKQCKGEYDHIRLDKDIENHKTLTDEDYLLKKVEDSIAENNRMIEEGLSDRYDDLAHISYFSKEEISQKGHEMMLEALYEIFYESFDWERLESDLKNSIIQDNGYNAEVSIINQRAIERLKDPGNYIGKKKHL